MSQIEVFVFLVVPGMVIAIVGVGAFFEARANGAVKPYADFLDALPAVQTEDAPRPLTALPSKEAME